MLSLVNFQKEVKEAEEIVGGFPCLSVRILNSIFFLEHPPEFIAILWSYVNHVTGRPSVQRPLRRPAPPRPLSPSHELLPRHPSRNPPSIHVVPRGHQRPYFHFIAYWSQWLNKKLPMREVLCVSSKREASSLFSPRLNSRYIRKPVVAFHRYPRDYSHHRRSAYTRLNLTCAENS